MAVPQVERAFCGACSLQTGTKIIAVILLGLNIYLLVSHVRGLNDWYKFEQELKKIHPEVVVPDPTKQIRSEIGWLAVSCVLQLLLLLAAFKKWATIVFFWVLVACFSLIVVVGYILILLLKGGTLNERFIIFLVVYAIKVYFIVVVYSFYRELKKGHTEGEDNRV